MMNRLRLWSVIKNRLCMMNTDPQVLHPLIFLLFFAAAVGQPWARLEQPHPHPGPGDFYMEPAHHHGEHMHRHYQDTRTFYLFCFRNTVTFYGILQ